MKKNLEISAPKIQTWAATNPQFIIFTFVSLIMVSRFKVTELQSSISG